MSKREDRASKERPRKPSRRRPRRSARRGASFAKPARAAVEKRVRALAGSEAARKASTGAAKLLGGGLAIVVEAARIAREMLVIPTQLWLALAEVAGRIVLGGWDRLRPLLVAAARGARSLLRLAERELTPARVIVVVALVALGALAASQWVDYRGISVGTGDYAGGVESVAPAPEVLRDRAGEAHGWLMLPIAGAGLVVLALAALGRWRVARLLIPLGLAVIAISILVDVPKGLDEGDTAIAYEGAKARLLEGFWAQTMVGGLIAVCGILVPMHLRPARARRARASRPAGRRRRRTAGPRSGPKAASA